MLKFRVRSNEGTWDYRLVVSKTETGITISCDCRAARHGSFCKHRVRLIRGDPTMLQSKNKEDVALVAEMFKGSRALALIDAIAEMEAAAETLKLDIAAAKGALSAELWFEPK